MGAHHGTDEVGVILVWSSVVDEVARLHVLSRRSDCSGGSERNNFGEDLHADYESTEQLIDRVMDVVDMN